MRPTVSKAEPDYEGNNQRGPISQSSVLEGHGRKRIVGELGLLKAQDVGFESFKPSFDTSESRIQGVDIPGRNPHGGDLTE